jgi:hypothetical protein
MKKIGFPGGSVAAAVKNFTAGTILHLKWGFREQPNGRERRCEELLLVHVTCTPPVFYRKDFVVLAASSGMPGSMYSSWIEEAYIVDRSELPLFMYLKLTDRFAEVMKETTVKGGAS